MAQHNEGIIVSGGSFSGGQVVTGRGSQALQIAHGAAEELREAGNDRLATAVESFLEALETHAARIASLEEVVEAVRQMSEEASKERPSKWTLQGLLEGIKGVVSPVAEVMPAFAALYGAMAPLIGLPRP